MDLLESEIRQIVEDGESHEQISRFLRTVLPSQRGLSSRSVRRFCSLRGIRYRRGLTSAELDHIVSSRVRTVGLSYGRRSMQGLLRSQGMRVSQARIGSALRTFPLAHAQRVTNIVHHINPVPYRATFFGEKLHFDQNEKLNMYGVVHVLAVDGYSRKIVGFITLPRKYPTAIYRYLFHPVLLRYGMWQQLRMDHGTEFALVSTVQLLAHMRIPCDHRPVLRSLSRHNHRAERLWPEVNARINYPVKRILVRMEESQQIDMTDGITKFSVSWVTIVVTASPIMDFIRAWNSHTIPGVGGGIPDVLARRNDRVTFVHPTNVPGVDSAVAAHVSQGGQLAPESSMVYGTDPNAGYPALQTLRDRDFRVMFPSTQQVFEDILHNGGILFQRAIISFMDLNRRYATLIL